MQCMAFGALNKGLGGPNLQTLNPKNKVVWDEQAFGIESFGL